MLRAEDNKFLTESGQGTGMGELLRRFWIPVLLSEELPDADGEPNSVVCGIGTDWVSSDMVDRVSGDCENVARNLLDLTASVRRVHAKHAGRIAIRVRCGSRARTRCRGRTQSLCYQASTIDHWYH